jgi:hypothetical protein
MILTMTILNIIHIRIMKTFHNKTLVAWWCVCVGPLLWLNCLEIFIASAENFLSMILYLLTNTLYFCGGWMQALPWTILYSILHCVLRTLTMRTNCLKESCGFSSPLLMRISNSLPGSHLDHPPFFAGYL